MHTVDASPYYLTRTVGMTKDEHDILAIALEYTLQQARYDAKRDRYFLKCYGPVGLTTYITEEYIDNCVMKHFIIPGFLYFPVLND